MNALTSRVQDLITPSYPYSDPLIARRASNMMAVLLTLTLAGLPIAGWFAVEAFINDSWFDLRNLSFILLPIINGAGYVIFDRGRYTLAALLFLGFTISTTFAGFVFAPEDSGSNGLISLMLPVVMAGLLLGWRSVLLTYLITLATITQATILRPDTFDTTTIIAFAVSGGTVALFVTFIMNSTIQVARQNFDELRELQRTVGLTTLTANTTELDINSLALRAIDFARDQLGYNYAQIFILDANNRLQRRISSSLSRTQVNVDTNLNPDQYVGILDAARRDETLVIDTNSTAAQRNHLLPGISVGFAIPVHFEGNVIAVLDLQSERLGIVAQGDRSSLDLLAGQLGTAIGQSRLITDLRQNVAEQDRIIQRQREQLRSVEETTLRATVEAWSAYLQQRSLDYLGFDLDAEGSLHLSSDLPDETRQTLEDGEVVVEQSGEVQIVRVPITLRNRTIGAMTFRVPLANQVIGNRQIDLLQSVVQRLGLALENKRLFEQSREQARRENIASEIGNSLLSTTDIDSVLKLAAESFNEALGAIQTRIYIRPEATEPVIEDSP